MEPLLFPERFQPSFGDEIFTKKSISYPSFIPPNSSEINNQEENKLRRKWSEDDVEDHITDVRLDAALKRHYCIEQSDKTKSWKNIIDGTEYRERSGRWTEDERLVHSYDYVYDSNVTIFGEEELDEVTEEEIDNWFDQPYSEDLENDASNLFEDGEDYFETFKWESRVNAKRHWKVAGTPWPNVVDGIPESYRFVKWEQHFDVDDDEEICSDEDEDIFSERDIDSWFENPQCEDLESKPLFENDEYLYMPEEKNDTVKCLPKSESTTIAKPIKGILKNKLKDLSTDAELSTLSKTLQASVDSGKFSLEVSIFCFDVVSMVLFHILSTNSLQQEALKISSELEKFLMLMTMNSV